MNVAPYSYPSATGECQIASNIYSPDSGEYDTVLVIHHGMAEHQKRYLDFIRFLTDNGVAVYMHDMANHGASNADYENTGWFGARDGYKALVEDFRQNVLRAGRDAPGKKLIVMGHSMGSFICRLYTAWYPEDRFDGAIFMGTGGPNPIAGAGKTMSSLIGTFRGKRHKSPMLDRMAFGTYGKGFEGRTSFDWLTRDTEIVDRYVEDPYCGFLFTTQGMNDLIRANIECNNDKWFRSVRSDLPILLISGALDPVGEASRGVEAVEKKLIETGHTAVTLKLYPGCRHEVLNELNRDEVMADLLAWVHTV